MNKSGTGKESAQKKSEGEKNMETQDDKTKSAETKSSALGRNPLGGINQTGLEGLIGSTSKKQDTKNSDHKKPDSTDQEFGQELLYTKAVKLTQDDVEFVKDMAIAVKSEGNFSEGIRACIKAARKQYGDSVKDLASQRKSSEAVEI